jgi:hypothetical protein
MRHCLSVTSFSEHVVCLVCGEDVVHLNSRSVSTQSTWYEVSEHVVYVPGMTSESTQFTWNEVSEQAVYLA